MTTVSTRTSPAATCATRFSCAISPPRCPRPSTSSTPCTSSATHFTARRAACGAPSSASRCPCHAPRSAASHTPSLPTLPALRRALRRRAPSPGGTWQRSFSATGVGWGQPRGPPVPGVVPAGPTGHTAAPTPPSAAATVALSAATRSARTAPGRGWRCCERASRGTGARKRPLDGRHGWRVGRAGLRHQEGLARGRDEGLEGARGVAAARVGARRAEARAGASACRTGRGGC